MLLAELLLHYPWVMPARFKCQTTFSIDYRPPSHHQQYSLLAMLFNDSKSKEEVIGFESPKKTHCLKGQTPEIIYLKHIKHVTTWIHYCGVFSTVYGTFYLMKFAGGHMGLKQLNLCHPQQSKDIWIFNMVVFLCQRLTYSYPQSQESGVSISKSRH